MSMVSLRSCLLTAGVVRLLLYVYGLWQDTVMIVKYTDIDYVVFTDAARFMSQGHSPYQRATYRYTPLLAWLLQGNIYVCEGFGKLLFASCDIIAGYVIYRYCMVKNDGNKKQSIICASIWLFNPLTVTVSTRGNAESLMAVLVLLTLLMLSHTGYAGLLFSAVAYGLSVHMKIYPVTYALALYLHINEHYATNQSPENEDSWYSHLRCLWPTRGSVVFGLVSVSTFLFVTIVCHCWYGEEFLQNAYWYHVTRSDIRHNFSPYFYMLYLTGIVPRAMSLTLFLPQMILIILTSFKYHQDIAFACFIQTFIFVTFNKVCTSQYFLWYLCLLPLIIPRLEMRKSEAAFLILLWLTSQGVWLLAAYLLEFQGHNTFLYIWAAGLLFFVVNILILCRLLTSYSTTAAAVKSLKLS